MKFIDEYRGAQDAQKMARAIAAITTTPWTIMEICGGQTHSIMRFGLESLLPKKIRLIHGPGCPVCVTPLESIDRAIALALEKDVIFCSFGDMMRVPGSHQDLLSAKAKGADVRIVYSPTDALNIAIKHPEKNVVFFAIGFETTAPGNAWVVDQAKRRGIKNFFLLVSHVLVPPAIEAILSSKQNRVQGFLAAGHVCTVMGYAQYEPLAKKYQVPIVITGFEPLDILQGIHMCVQQLEQGRFQVENQYRRSVHREGNRPAQEIMRKVFKVAKRNWRGIGSIAQSGLFLRQEYSEFDAEKKFVLKGIVAHEPKECISALVLQGIKKPHECAVFGKRCRPQHPLGAPMVSSEGACAAYYRYRYQGKK